MKSLYVHYMNKYPGGRVAMSESSLDVYCAEGKHRVALRKNGAGQWLCNSEEFGCEDSHDLAPIPKDARVHKLFKDGKIGKDELHAERAPKAKALAKNGRVLSEDEAGKAPKAPQSESAQA